MSVPPEQIKVVRQWIEKAESDYRNFKNTLQMGDDCPCDTVCFHAQQCAEKYLKARLVYLSIDFPKIHDILEIIKLFPPGFAIPLTRQDAEEAATLAVKVRTAIRSDLPKDVLK